MSEENIIDGLDTFIQEDGSDSKKPDSKNRKKRKYKRTIDTPVIIAFFIVLVTILFFAGWKILFDTSLKGSWKLSFEDNGNKYSYGFTFDKNNVFHYSFGGITYTGKYKIDTENSTINVSSSSYGRYNINVDFKYDVVGNVFDGRGLVLTNPSDTELPFISSNEYEPIVQKYDDFKVEEKILGSWLYIDEESGYNYTFTFYKDGKYEYLCNGSRHIGSYKTENGQFTYNLVVDGGIVNEEVFKYSIDGDKLTFITDSFTDVLTKTNNKYSFKNEIN